MTDTERLNLIEHYGWQIICFANEVAIYNVKAEFKVTGKTLREAIDNALSAQFKWSTGG
jgi:hypothetical protein